MRGRFIIFEGIDRSGKTTQAALLVERLRAAGIDVVAERFPDRSTSIGRMIGDYLASTTTLDDHVVHLLFSANRWECQQRIRAALDAGRWVVCDRYALSGELYSRAKGLDADWCRAPDAGLLQPDLIVYLRLHANVATHRGNYGDERYERVDLQRRIMLLYDDALVNGKRWSVECVDASVSIELVAERVWHGVTSALVTSV